MRRHIYVCTCFSSAMPRISMFLGSCSGSERCMSVGGWLDWEFDAVGCRCVADARGDHVADMHTHTQRKDASHRHSLPFLAAWRLLLALACVFLALDDPSDPAGFIFLRPCAILLLLMESKGQQRISQQSSSYDEGAVTSRSTAD